MDDEWVHYSRAGIATRRTQEGLGFRLHVGGVERTENYEFSFAPERATLIYNRRGVRDDGETEIEGVTRSTQRRLGGTFTFLPAGARLVGWTHTLVPHRYTMLQVASHDELVAPLMARLEPALFFRDVELAALVERLATVVASPMGDVEALYAEQLAALVPTMLVRSRDNGKGARRVRPLSPRQARLIADYVEEHLGAPLRLADLSALISQSRAHFARTFHATFGQTPHAYVLARRLQRARAALAGEHSITEIAYANGFATSSHFSSAFRRAFGVSPVEDRRLRAESKPAHFLEPGSNNRP